MSSSSAVWNFFKKSSKDSVVCNLCGKNYKTSGNTSNLAAHLRFKHYHAFSEFKNAGGKLISVSDSDVSDSGPKPKRPALEKQKRLPFRSSSPIPSTSNSSSYIANEAEFQNIADLSATSPENYEVSTNVVK